jgi:hypothetical protein
MAATLTHRPSRRSPRARRHTIQHYMKRRMLMEKLEDRRLLEGVPTWTGTDEFQCGDPGCPLCSGLRAGHRGLGHQRSTAPAGHGRPGVWTAIGAVGSRVVGHVQRVDHGAGFAVLSPPRAGDHRRIGVGLQAIADRPVPGQRPLGIDRSPDDRLGRRRRRGLDPNPRQVRDVDAIHIVSHGQDGRVRLGQRHVDAPRIWTSTRIRSALGAGRSNRTSDILFYGCNLASSEAGRQFVNELQELVGVDVAASIDTTGDYQRGNNWDLEYQTGPIEAQNPFSEELLQSYAPRWPRGRMPRAAT